MVTPRGYANKYDVTSGDTRDGEQRGRSLSTGLDGWSQELRASADSPAVLAARFGLPLTYLQQVLAEPAPAC
jgi:precorrin-3B C17-methyltransferase